jgi:hypothetical protein
MFTSFTTRLSGFGASKNCVELETVDDFSLWSRSCGQSTSAIDARRKRHVVPGPASRTSRFRPRVEHGWDSGRGEKQGKMTALSLLMVDLPHAFSNPSLVSTCAGGGGRVGWEIMAREISHVQVLFSNERVAVPRTPRLDFDYSKIAEQARGPGVRRGERGRGNELESDDHGEMSQLPSHQCHACVSEEGPGHHLHPQFRILSFHSYHQSKGRVEDPVQNPFISTYPSCLFTPHSSSTSYLAYCVHNRLLLAFSHWFSFLLHATACRGRSSVTLKIRILLNSARAITSR